MIVNGWTLLFHETVVTPMGKLALAYQRALKADPAGYHYNSNVKLFTALATLMMEVIPADPSRREYRQGLTLGKEYKHWFRAKFFGRYRLFFRYDSRSRIIVYAWVNDEEALRQRGGKRDPYEVFSRMLASGNPPDDWTALVKSCSELPDDILPIITGSKES